MSFTTDLIHSIPVDEATGAISVPIYQTTTFVHSSPGVHQGYDYTRSGNPTRKVLEDLIAKAEKGSTGAAFASGMAAIDAVLRLLKAGDHIIAGNDIYGGTYRLLTTLYKNVGITVSFVDLQSEAEIQLALTPQTRLIWVETPTNPSLKIVDIRKVARIAKAHNVWLAVDNTFATPAAQRPIELGADFVVHSATKYIGGHSDVISGLVVAATKELGEQILFVQNATGAILSPIESWLLIRGLETLELRFRQHSENAQAIAEYLSERPEVKEVFYPGLKVHAGHAIATSQQKYFGGIVSFRLRNDTWEAARKFTTVTKLFKLAESLGGIKSLIAHPASMTHASIPKERHAAFGITDGLLRLSVGLEEPTDLIADLRRALKAVSVPEEIIL
ncbi:MAG: PLP-dependent transferase [Cyclobacteriaceae bacterium]|nr:PLP-dependent transferase [Cyclobacteriaceae bacterium]